MSEQALYLSNDKSHVMDADGKVVYVRTETKEKIFYAEPSLTKDRCANGKVCIQVSSKKVCVEWNDNKFCIGWDDIEVCVKWECA